MADAPEEPARRTPAGAALPREAVTRAIHAATLVELASAGYGRTSVEAVARRAGVGKAAIYRRWPSKLALVAGVLREAALAEADVPDAGSLQADVRAFLVGGRALLTDPARRQLLLDLSAEAAREPELARVLDEAVGGPRRARGRGLVERAVARGELRPEVDAELALDLVPGPLHWRLAVRRGALDDDELDRLTAALVAGLRAL